MHGYVPGEQPAGGALIKLNTNENPYPPTPQVAEAVASEAAGAGLRLYPSPMADALREKAAQVYALSPAQVLVGNGSDDILAICLRACVSEGDEVAYTVPTYFVYRTLVDIAGARRVEIPYVPADDGRGSTAPQIVRLPDALVESGARVKFVCSPNSPLGYVVPLEEVARLAAASTGLVVADEAYGDFGEGSAIELLADHPNLLVARSFSKSYSLAGARLGLAFASPQLLAGLAKVKDSYNVSRFSLAAGVAALDDQDWMRGNVAKVKATRARTVAELRVKGWAVRESGANFIWIDCSAQGGKPVYDRLRARNVLVRWFDEPGLTDGIRVTIGTDEEMSTFLSAIAS